MIETKEVTKQEKEIAKLQRALTHAQGLAASERDWQKRIAQTLESYSFHLRAGDSITTRTGGVEKRWVLSIVDGEKGTLMLTPLPEVTK